MSTDKNRRNRTHRKTAARKLQAAEGISYQAALNRIIANKTPNTVAGHSTALDSDSWILLAWMDHQGHPHATITPFDDLRRDYSDSMNGNSSRPDYDVALDAAQNFRLLSDVHLAWLYGHVPTDVEELVLALDDIDAPDNTIVGTTGFTPTDEPDVFEATVVVLIAGGSPATIRLQCDGDPAALNAAPSLDTFQQWVAADAQFGISAEIPSDRPPTRSAFDALIDRACEPHTSTRPFRACVDRVAARHFGDIAAIDAAATADAVRDLGHGVRVDAVEDYIDRLRESAQGFLEDGWDVE